MEKNQDGIRDVKALGTAKMLTLGVQHTFTMFGATVLVPILTGLDVSVSLLLAGVGTLLFHVITGFKVPAFLGSSFAFIAPIAAATAAYGLAAARGGIVVAGLIYVVLAGIMAVFGVEKVVKLFPPVVTGPIIIIIGLTLSGVAIGNASQDWVLAIITFAIVAGISIYAKGFLKVIPVIIGLIVSYIIAMILGRVDYSTITNAAWFGLPKFELAEFNIGAILTVAPIALATMVEHIGDISAIGATTGDNYLKDPGLTRTLIGDGVATSISALFGGPANTTYSENTGVLALTKAYDPLIMRIAAVCAILLGLVPKVGGAISSIPIAVIGGVSIILFGMISAVGVRTLVENQVDFKQSRNLIIAATIFILGLGGAALEFNIGEAYVKLEGLALAAIVGIILNVIFPKTDKAQE